MTGIDVRRIPHNEPAVARAAAVVKLVNQAAAALRKIRDQKGLSQNEMAKQLDLSQPRIAQLESGRPSDAPSLQQIAEYASAAGKEVSILDSDELAQIEDKIPSLEKQLHQYEEHIYRQTQQIQQQKRRTEHLEGLLGRLLFRSGNT